MKRKFRPILLKFQNIKDKNQNASRKNQNLHQNFSFVTQPGVQRQWGSTFKSLEDKEFELRILSPQTLKMK